MSFFRGFLTIILLLAVSFSAFPQIDSIVYTVKKIERANKNCPQTERYMAGGCTKAILIWPEITGSTNNAVARVVIDRLRADIALKTHQFFVNGGFAKKPEDVPETFIREIDADREEWGMSNLPLDYLREIQVLFNSEYIFSFGVYEGGYTGGAHSNYSQSAFNYSLITGQLLSLEYIFPRDKMEELLVAAEKIFRKSLDLPQDGFINEHGFWFPENKLYLSSEFFPSKDGITFIYNPYEIAPYSAGEIRLFLPYSAISQYLSSWGPLKHHAPPEQ
ncbi:MAG: DUF3298 domain-containing protein [Ignavibacteriaceae bacterium]|nr:DUF3298 domain-containing protein [Ignavibacteriaceae bacterium]